MASGVEGGQSRTDSVRLGGFSSTGYEKLSRSVSTEEPTPQVLEVFPVSSKNIRQFSGPMVSAEDHHVLILPSLDQLVLAGLHINS